MVPPGVKTRGHIHESEKEGCLSLGVIAQWQSVGSLTQMPPYHFPSSLSCFKGLWTVTAQIVSLFSYTESLCQSLDCKGSSSVKQTPAVHYHAIHFRKSTTGYTQQSHASSQQFMLYVCLNEGVNPNNQRVPSNKAENQYGSVYL